MHLASWIVEQPGAPMRRQPRDEHPGHDDVIVQVAGCGVCHTDLGFFYDGVPTRHPFPLTLGHEISGRVVEAGAGAEAWLGRAVVVPAVHAVRRMRARAARAAARSARSRSSRATTCTAASRTHVRVPARGLCPVPDLADADVNPGRLDARDAVGDRRRRLDALPGHRAQRTRRRATSRCSSAPAASAASACRSPRALGAHVVAIDVDDARLARWRARRGRSTLDAATSRLRRRCASAVREFARRARHPVVAHGRSSRPRARRPGRRPRSGCSAHGGYLVDRRLHAEDRRGAAVEPDGVRRDRAGQLGLPARALPGRPRSGARRAASRSSRSSSGARSPRSTTSSRSCTHGRVARRIVLIPGGLTHDVQEPRPHRPRPTRPAFATRSVPLRDAGRRDGARPARRADHARQPDAAQLVHHRDGEGRDPRHAPRVERPRARSPWSSPAPARARSAPAATPPSTPSTTRAGPRSTASTCGSSTTWSARSSCATSRSICRVNGMRIARRPGDRHGVRLLGRAGPRACSARPGRGTARRPTAAAPTSCRCSSASRPRWRAARCASTGARTRRSASASLTKVVPGAQGRRTLRRRTRWSSPIAGSTSGRIVYGELQDGRRARRRQGAARARRGRPVAARRGGRRARLQAGEHDARAASPRRSRACASTSSSTGTATARATARGSALNMMTEGARRASARSTRARKACREADFLLLRRRLAEGAAWGDALIEEILAKARSDDARRCPSSTTATTSALDSPLRRRPRGRRAHRRAPHRRANSAAYWTRVFARVPRRRRRGRRASALAAPTAERLVAATCSARCARSSSDRAVRLDLRGRRRSRRRRATASASALARRGAPRLRRRGRDDACARWSAATTCRCSRSSAPTASPAARSSQLELRRSTSDVTEATTWRPSPVRVERLEDDRVLARHARRARRATSSTARSMDALDARVRATRPRAPHAASAICLEGAGAHFSFGASVQEHLPDRSRRCSREFHATVPRAARQRRRRRSRPCAGSASAAGSSWRRSAIASSPRPTRSSASRRSCSACSRRSRRIVLPERVGRARGRGPAASPAAASTPTRRSRMRPRRRGRRRPGRGRARLGAHAPAAAVGRRACASPCARARAGLRRALRRRARRRSSGSTSTT